MALLLFYPLPRVSAVGCALRIINKPAVESPVGCALRTINKPAVERCAMRTLRDSPLLAGLTRVGIGFFPLLG